MDNWCYLICLCYHNVPACFYLTLKLIWGYDLESAYSSPLNAKHKPCPCSVLCLHTLNILPLCSESMFSSRTWPCSSLEVCLGTSLMQAPSSGGHHLTAPGISTSTGAKCCGERLSFRHLHSQLGTWCVIKVIEHVKVKSDNVIMMQFCYLMGQVFGGLI